MKQLDLKDIIKIRQNEKIKEFKKNANYRVKWTWEIIENNRKYIFEILEFKNGSTIYSLKAVFKL